MTNAKCKSCGAPIRWCATESGKAMPVDLVPVRGGNIRLRDEGTRCVAVYVTAPLFETGPRYVSHFATCPHAAAHRRKAS